MSDLHHDDYTQGPCIVTFDGRILELFTAREGGKERMIVGMLHVDVGDPNRHGRRDVKFTCMPGFRSGGGFFLTVTEEQWPAVEVFVREVQAAL